MIPISIRFTILLGLLVLSLLLPSAPVVCAQSADASQVVTWTCVGNPCFWGGMVSGYAVVWPETMAPLAGRLGYTTSAGVYLPADAASGITIAVTAGTAAVYAGLPDVALHRVLAALSAGQSFEITGLATDEIVSVQNVNNAFAYELILPTGIRVPSTPTEGTEPVPPGSTASQLVTWICTINQCYWGDSAIGNAVV